MITLIHTSKTMRPAPHNAGLINAPIFINQADQLAKYLKSLGKNDLVKMMKLSEKLATDTISLIANWNHAAENQRQAIDSFLGDIYSGLQLSSWSHADLNYANNHLLIVSGLYGLLKPKDGIYPYRLEMNYKLPGIESGSLYKYWGRSLADQLPVGIEIVNLAAKEYGKLITDYLDSGRIIEPRFLTISPKTNQPTFVVIHAKIARGAFARWMIKNRVENTIELVDFKDLGYSYKPELSSISTPTFICKKFEGLGLSVRLDKQVL
jgi:cytoplasmic iron level regulating protein YaaA (DUF328/UPF0246 family)